MSCPACGGRISRLNRKGVCHACFARSRGAIRANRSRIDWCPPEYRDGYFRLRAKAKLPAAEARRIVEDEIAADDRAFEGLYNRAM